MHQLTNAHSLLLAFALDIAPASFAFGGS